MGNYDWRSGSPDSLHSKHALAESALRSKLLPATTELPLHAATNGVVFGSSAGLSVVLLNVFLAGLVLIFLNEKTRIFDWCMG
jgi:hypothetical protein